MNTPAVIQLRLPRSIKAGLERAAKRDGTSMNQLIATAVAEKLSALETMDFFVERARKADLDAFARFMNREGGEPPSVGDELPDLNKVHETRIDYGVQTMPRVSETDVEIAVVKYLHGIAGHTATIRQIKNALPLFLNLSATDRRQSETRPREELWEQQVRNIVSHRNTPGNFIYEGRLEHAPGRLTLTASGLAYAGKL